MLSKSILVVMAVFNSYVAFAGESNLSCVVSEPGQTAQLASARLSEQGNGNLEGTYGTYEVKVMASDFGIFRAGIIESSSGAAAVSTAPGSVPARDLDLRLSLKDQHFRLLCKVTAQ